MKKKKNLLSKFLALITYKKAKPAEKFYIPEIEESRQKSSVSPKIKKKKPIPLAKVHKLKKKADDNTISTDVECNKEYLQTKFNSPTNKDFVIREIIIAGKYRAFIAFLDGMVNNSIINNFVLRPILQEEKFKDIENRCQLDQILDSIIETNQTIKVPKPTDIISEILSGNTALYVEGCKYYLSCETKGFPSRGVEKPQTEGVVKGAQEGFNETLRTNTTLIRKIIKNSNLTTEFVPIGDRNHLQCALMYLKDVVNPAIVEEAKKRISSIKTDYIAGDGFLEQFIDDNPWALVPTILATERPDRTASHIMEGKVAIIAEGTPFALIVPVTLHSFFHSPEDANLHWQYATALRFIRVLATLIAILLPGIYVALTTYHHEMIPTDLLIAIAKARENVPFPSVVEILLMELSFELIREAGIRIPGIIGNTLGIIGALILGQAAVQANIVSPVLVIIIAVTGLGNFAIPNFSMAFGVRILRFIFIFTGAFLGFFGISLALVVISALVVQMKSFGVPFYSPLAPKTRRSTDLFIKWPVWMQEMRPDYANSLDRRRQPHISRKWTKEE